MTRTRGGSHATGSGRSRRERPDLVGNTQLTDEQLAGVTDADIDAATAAAVAARNGGTNMPRHAALGEPVSEAPAGGAASRPESPAGAKAERRKRRRPLRVAFGLGVTALAVVGAGYVIAGANNDDGPKEAPKGPALLETGAPAPAKGAALLEQLKGEEQVKVNNGENGKEVNVLIGTVTTNGPDGKVTYTNPIFNLTGVPEAAVKQMEAGKFDPATLGGLARGRLFALGEPHNIPTPGHPENYDRGITAIDLSAGAQIKPGGVAEVAVGWEEPNNVAVTTDGDPLAYNTKTAEVAQHAAKGDWEPLVVGEQS
jgi:hypothetical protein